MIFTSDNKTMITIAEPFISKENDFISLKRKLVSQKTSHKIGLIIQRKYRVHGSSMKIILLNAGKMRTLHFGSK